MFIEVNNTKLFYEKSGNGKALILIHGNGEDHTIFDEIVPLLSANFEVYAIDSRGHGQSAPTTTFDYSVMAADVFAFIEKLNLQKPIFYGFSDGGIIGLLLASQHADALSKLIVSGANATPKGIVNKCRFMFRLKYFFNRAPLLKLMITQPNISAADLQKISVPTLVLVGEYDLIKLAHTQYIAKNIPHCTLKIISGEDHGSYIVHSTKLFDIIQPFLNQK